MAGTLLHVTLALRAADAAGPAARAAALRHPHDYLLGAVLIDLPYYDRLWRTALGMALGRPLRYHPTGGALHRRSPAALCAALLDAARTPAERAIGLGCLTHLAVDLVFHPEICRRVGAAPGSAADPDGVHKRIENEMDLHCHYDLLGTSGVGTAHARRALALSPRSDWTALALGAIARVHGGGPAPEALAAWRAQLALYGVASSLGATPWTKTLPADDPELLERSLALAAEAIALAARCLEAGLAYADGGIDRAALLAVTGDRSALDGGPAEPPL